MTTFATKDEWVTCENGHRICQFTHDVDYGDIQAPWNDFTNWQQREPRLGEPSTEIKCEICGAAWFAGSGTLHFADEWR